MRGASVLAARPAPATAVPHAPTVLILVNKATTILNFRAELVTALAAAGYRVVISVPPGERVEELAALGATVTVILTPMDKEGTSPRRDLALLCRYRRLIRSSGADMVLTYTAKPNIYGALAAGRVPVLATVTGRGRALAADGWLGWFMRGLYRTGLRRAAGVFFQNEADLSYFAAHRIGGRRTARTLVPGSGVNLERFASAPYPVDEPLSFAYVARLCPEKGIEDYLAIAGAVRTRHPEVTFHVCGFGDAAIEARLRALDAAGVITFHGALRDVRPILRAVHAVIHPTDYPEGMANILLEASATGRPVITTDRPGCREAVEDGVTGRLVSPRDPAALEAAVEWFCALSPAERAAMGRAARRRVERVFDRRLVVEAYLAAIATHLPT